LDLRETAFFRTESKPRVAAGQEMIRKKNSQGRGKAREFYLQSGKIDVLKKSHVKLK